MTHNPGMVALIDGDILVYRAGFSAQSNYHVIKNVIDGFEIIFEPHITKKEVILVSNDMGLMEDPWVIETRVSVRPVAHALQSCKLIIEQILKKLDTHKFKLYLTSTNHSNYRYKIAKTKKYKGNRTAPRPAHYDEIREYMVNVWGAEVIDGREADDAMGCEQMRYHNSSISKGLDSCIVSIDKDMDMIPGWHYNFVKDRMYFSTNLGSLELYNIEPSGRQGLRGSGLMWFYAQTLLGDSADNIPGIRGIGAVSTHKLLKDCGTEKEMHAVVKKVYNEHKVEERLEEVANLLWIQRQDNVLWRIP